MCRIDDLDDRVAGLQMLRFPAFCLHCKLPTDQYAGIDNRVFVHIEIDTRRYGDTQDSDPRLTGRIPRQRFAIPALSRFDKFLDGNGGLAWFLVRGRNTARGLQEDNQRTGRKDSDSM